MSKKILLFLSPVIDGILSIVIVPAAYLLLGFRKFGAARLKRTTCRLKSIGVFPIRNHYYEPLFDDKLLKHPLNKERFLPGIDLNVGSQLRFLKELVFSNELIELNINDVNNKSFCVVNSSFSAGDAEFLYQFIRFIKPSRLVEIGSGNSTKIARLAILKNKSEYNRYCSHVCIEPYEMPWLEKCSEITVVRELVEDCKFNWYTELSAGDILFIDSSHIIRPQGDVLKEYLEIIPLLAAGVYVHVHDIFTPRNYPSSWVVEDVKLWNEQYLLEALLTNTNRYEVIAALNLLKCNYYTDLKNVCPYLDHSSEPGSFYFRVKN